MLFIILGILVLVGGIVVSLFGLIVSIGGEETPSNVPADPESFVEVPGIEGLTANDENIKLDTSYVSINIVPDESEQTLKPDQSPAEIHPEDKIEGVTEDGIKWSTSKTDGSAAIHLNVNGKSVKSRLIYSTVFSTA